MRRPGGSHFAGERDRLLGVVGCGAGNHWYSPGGLLHGYLDDTPVFRGRHGSRLPGRATRNEEVNAARDLPVDERAQGTLVHIPRFRKGGNERCSTASE